MDCWKLLNTTKPIFEPPWDPNHATIMRSHGVSRTPSSSPGSTSSIASDTSSLTDAPTFDSEFSKKAHQGEPTAIEPSQFDYSKVDWKRLPGFSVPIARPSHKLISGIWRVGVPIEHTATNKRWWLCLRCHTAGNDTLRRHRFNVEQGSSNPVEHIRKAHNETFNEKREIVPLPPSIPAPSNLDSTQPREQAILNDLALAFDETKFQQLLVRWIVCDNVSFRQVDSKPFRELIHYLSPRAGDALPSHPTVREWILKAYRCHKAAVKQELQTTISKIHISFDLWTSGNCLSLNGIVAHFINAKFESKAILLATPEQSSSHAGLDIAEQVIRVIKDFGIQDKLGFFVLDNASNNDTAMEVIAEEFGFRASERRLRCAGHIINLIARNLLFGFDRNLFELEDSVSANLKDELKRWRRTGPVGKAHNLIVWIYASPQRRKRWHDAQVSYHKSAIDPSLWHTIKPRELHRSNDTRWNSIYDEIETLCKLRAPFEEFLDSERQRALKETNRGRWTEDEDAAQNVIVKDALDKDDWEILIRYKDLLKPCWAATMDLQGQPGDGKSCGLSNVQADIECVVEHFTTAYSEYKDASPATTEGEWHFATQIKLALDKAEEYYAKLGDSPAYLAATVLHPSYTWKYIDAQWANQKSWITRGKRAVKALWVVDYKQYPISEAISPPKKQSNHEPNMMEEYRMRGLTQARSQRDKQTITDEFERYNSQVQVDTRHPLDWWRTVGVTEYPHLAQMAFDMLSIPAMSDEPERLFSRLGLMITKRRNHLDQSTIQAAQCLHSWDKAGIIDLRKSSTPSQSCT